MRGKVNKKEMLFFFGVFLFNLRLIIISTKIIELSSLIQNIILVISTTALLIKIALNKSTIYQNIIYSIILIVFFINYRIIGDSILFFTMLIIIASREIEIKKIVKFLFIFNAISINICMIYGCSAYFFDQELLTSMFDGNERYVFCFKHPNVLSAYVIWTYIMYIFLRDFKITKKNFIFGALLVVFIGTFPKSRTAMIILILFLILIIKNYFNKKILIGQLLSRNSVILCCILSMTLLYCYNDNTIMRDIDSAVSGRIRLGSYVNEIYGAKIMGQELPIDKKIKFNLKYRIDSFSLDNAYYRLIYNNGIVISGIYLFYLIKENRISNENEEKTNSLLFNIVAIYMLMESLSISVVLTFPLLYMRDRIGERK